MRIAALRFAISGKARQDVSVRRRLAYLLIWTLATAATVGASWLGIRSVLQATAPQRTAPFSAAELRRMAPTTPPPLASTVAPPIIAPTASLPAPASTSPAPTPAVSASPSPGATWAAVPTGSGGPAYERTFVVRGGTVTLRVDQSEVRAVDAVAGSGFVVVHTRYDERSLLVSFLSAAHISRVFVTWRDGPYAEVTESVT